jgi:hypothetical protein
VAEQVTLNEAFGFSVMGRGLKHFLAFTLDEIEIKMKLRVKLHLALR